MRCGNCGGDLSPGTRECPICGKTRPPLLPRFMAAERRYIALAARYQSGQLDRDGFRAKLHELAFEDEDGNYWTIGARDARWYVYDGQQWVPRDPPVARRRPPPRALG